MVYRIIADRFRLEKNLDNSDSLWRATDINDNKPILIRLLPVNKRSIRNWVRLESTLEEIVKMNCEYVASVIEWGDCAEGKYIALEWLEGQPLSECKLNLSSMLTKLLYVGKAYKQLIEHDIVHFSITANNVIVTSDKVKVFGFDSLLSERTKLKKIQSSRLLKTLNWIAPELLDGKKRSLLSCLYSFGLLSYRALTGRLPFQTNNPNSLVWDIKYGLPDPVSMYNPNVPVSIENMIKRLLHKEPNARLQSFTQVISCLEKAIVESSNKSTISIKTGLMLHKGRLIGKHQQITAVQSVVTNPEKSFVVIEGENGTGKTRFLHDMICILRDLDISSIFITCEPSMKDSPWTQVASFISEVIEDFGIGIIGRSEYKRVFASINPQLRSRVLVEKKDLLNDTNKIRVELEGAFPWLLSKIIKQKKLLVIIDDAHYCDDESLILMIDMVRNSAEKDIALFLACDSSNSKQLISKYLSQIRYTRIPINPLTPKQTQEMATSVLGSSVIPLNIIDILHHKTKGNPLDVLQILAGLVSSGKIVNAGMTCESNDIPNNRDDIAKFRLEHLDKKTLSVLSEASVLGNLFKEDVLIEISSHPRQFVEDVLETASMSMLLSMDKTNQGYQYHFVLNEFRIHLLNQMNVSQKKCLHDRIAKTLLKIYGDDIDYHIDELTIHIIGGTEQESSVEHLIKASKIALKNYKLKKAINLSKQAKEFAVKTGNTRLIINASVQYSNLIILMGDKYTASESIEGTYSALSKIGINAPDESNLLIEMANIELLAGDIDKAEQLVRKVYTKFGKTLNKVQVARCHMIESGSIFHIDKHTSYEHIKKSVDRLIKIDVPEIAGLAIIEMMRIELSLGDYKSAERTRLIYVDRFAKRSCVSIELYYLSIYVMMNIQLGKIEEAHKLLVDLWAKAMKLGATRYRVIGSYLRSTLLRYRGNTIASLELSRRSLELAKSIDSKVFIGRNLVNIGEILLQRECEIDLNIILEECRVADLLVKQEYKTPGYELLLIKAMTLGKKYANALEKAKFILNPGNSCTTAQERFEISCVVADIYRKQSNFSMAWKQIEQIKEIYSQQLTNPVNTCNLYLLEGDIGISLLTSNFNKSNLSKRVTLFSKYGVSTKNVKINISKSIEKAYVVALSSGLELQSALATLCRARYHFVLYQIDSSEKHLIKANTLLGISEMLAESLRNEGLMRRVKEFIKYKESHVSNKKE